MSKSFDLFFNVASILYTANSFCPFDALWWVELRVILIPWKTVNTALKHFRSNPQTSYFFDPWCWTEKLIFDFQMLVTKYGRFTWMLPVKHRVQIIQFNFGELLETSCSKFNISDFSWSLFKQSVEIFKIKKLKKVCRKCNF